MMTNELKELFPMIRERETILKEIQSNSKFALTYATWSEEQQKEFLDICSGAHGFKFLYDGFFKEIMNPDAVPERLEEILSLLLGHTVSILQVLPNEGGRISGENSLLIMDIVIEMDDGSVANVEIQKIGIAFPGQRSACYSSDLLLRQYKRVKSKKQKLFSYKDIQKVYTIIFFEKSPKDFKDYPTDYIHHFSQRSDTGLHMELLQEFFFIPLDIYKNSPHNKDITTRLDAWLTFFSTDTPDEIIHLLEAHPDFKKIYEEIYQLCQNMERVMDMFSEELRILDENTIKYMVEEMQEEIDQQKVVIEKNKQRIDEQSQTIDEQSQTIDEQLQMIKKLQSELKALRNKKQ